ncbi:MAG: DUF4342 domain-containing protein [Nocardiopsis sp. BM-2018]|nr:MAG: DUF4342 domain-containing protein [Nocardiopsis sp. BM-2018]
MRHEHDTTTAKDHVEEFRVSGEAVLAKVKELVREGNVRRITIKNEEGRTLIEIPLTIGVIGTVLLPVWAAIGAIAALAANLTLAVERRAPQEPAPADATHATTGTNDDAPDATVANDTTEGPR